MYYRSRPIWVPVILSIDLDFTTELQFTTNRAPVLYFSTYLQLQANQRQQENTLPEIIGLTGLDYAPCHSNPQTAFPLMPEVR